MTDYYPVEGSNPIERPRSLSLLERIGEWFGERVDLRYSNHESLKIHRYLQDHLPSNLFFPLESSVRYATLSPRRVKPFLQSLPNKLITLDTFDINNFLAEDMMDEDTLNSPIIGHSILQNDERCMPIFIKRFYAILDLTRLLDETEKFLRTVLRCDSKEFITDYDLEHCFKLTYGNNEKLPHQKFSEIIVNYFNSWIEYFDILPDEPDHGIHHIKTDQIETYIDIARINAKVFPKICEIVFGDIGR